MYIWINFRWISSDDGGGEGSAARSEFCYIERRL